MEIKRTYGEDGFDRTTSELLSTVAAIYGHERGPERLAYVLNSAIRAQVTHQSHRD